MPKTISRGLLRKLRRYVNAEIKLSWIAMDPANRDSIRLECGLAKAALWNHLAELETGLHGSLRPRAIEDMEYE